MSDLDSLSSSVSILLGVLTYFLTVVYDGTNELFKIEVPAIEQQAKRKSLRADALRFFLTANLPLVAGFGGLFYLCLPTVVRIIRTAKFELWNFDALRTLFVFLEIGILACFVLSAVLALGVGKRIRNLSAPPRKTAGKYYG